MIIEKEKKVKKIILTGGGTGGSVSPLLAIAEELSNLAANKESKFEFLWIGTRKGIEREMVRKAGIKFMVIYSGKLRRYFSLKNFIDPFLIIIGFFQVLTILIVWRPNLVMSAGSFVSVPVAWAAWILRIPILIHQQDVCPGLANKLVAPLANIITVTFRESLKNYGKKAVWTGNPVQLSIMNYELSIKEIFNKFNLKNNLPVVLVVGGVTGAVAVNKLVQGDLGELTKFCQIIHITGKNKKTKKQKNKKTNYYSFEFLDAKKMAEVLQITDVVVSRCGLGFLTELSYLGKPAILIPIPDTHQEYNAQIFKAKEAAIVLDQNKLTSKELASTIKRLLDDNVLRSKLRNNIKAVIKRGANEKIANIIKNLI